MLGITCQAGLEAVGEVGSNKFLTVGCQTGLEEADRAEDDFQELKRAALDGMSTRRRLRTAVLPVHEGQHETVDVKKLGRAQRADLVSKVSYKSFS